MARFKYVAKDMSGKVHKGTVEAASENALTQQLREENLYLVEAKDLNGAKKHKKLKAELFNLLMDAKNNKDILCNLKDRAGKLQGKLSYFEYIEPGYGKYVVEKLEKKVGITLKSILIKG